MRYFGYERVSTESQVERGGGLSMQEQAIERYCNEHGITLADTFIDAGVSGAVADVDDDAALSKRTGLVELLGTLEDGDAVIVYSTSRLWRSDTARVLIRRELLRKHVQVISIDNPRYSLTAKDPTSRLLDSITEALDEWEKLEIAVKLQRGRAAKAKTGAKPCGVAPFGYQWADSRKEGVIINEQEAVIVRKMFSLAQTGLSLQAIADKINATGARTRHGKPFSKGTIQAVLRNRFYRGDLVYGGVTYSGNHTAIISRVVFGKVAKQLDRRKRG